MTDKEPVMIKGIDVSKCRYFCIYDETCRDENIGHIVRPACKNVPDCYFKQFARKTAECEQYEQACDKIKEVCLENTHTFADGTKLRYDSLDDILDIISKTKDGNNDR